MAPPIWVIDTSSLIQIRSGVPRPDRERVYDALSELVRVGRLLFPRQVLDELKRDSDKHHPDRVCTWALGVEVHACARSPSFEEVRAVLVIVPDILDPAKDSGADEADPYVLAMARRVRDEGADGRVVTEETRNSPTKLSLNTALGVDRSTIRPPKNLRASSSKRLIVDLLAHGKRVGVTAQSHKVIHNLLREIGKAARETNVSFLGLKKASEDSDTWYEDDFIECTANNAVVESFPAGVMLFAGTAWLFSRPGMEQSLDDLFIDEAGQIALADALAVGTAAQNIVLLGDPSQLAQVSTGSHPAGAERSVLEHLLGAHATIPQTHGLFIEESWRLYPSVCRFVSDVVYDGRLRSRPHCDRQAPVPYSRSNEARECALPTGRIRGDAAYPAFLNQA